MLLNRPSLFIFSSARIYEAYILEVIPVLFSFECVLIPWRKVVAGQSFFLSKRGTTKILISWYQIYAKRTKIFKVMPILVISWCVLNPLLIECARSETIFLIKRCKITIPISWYQIYAKRTKVLEVIPVLVNSGRVLIPYWKSVVQVGVKLISYQKMYNHNTDQLIPKLCQTNKDFRSYSHFSQFWACF